jgi:hypothetical protein
MIGNSEITIADGISDSDPDSLYAAEYNPTAASPCIIESITTSILK